VASNPTSKQKVDELLEEMKVINEAYAIESAFIALSTALIESGALQTSRLRHHLHRAADECDSRGLPDAGVHLDLISECIPDVGPRPARRGAAAPTGKRQ
jgi:hypothetical protein